MELKPLSVPPRAARVVSVVAVAALSLWLAAQIAFIAYYWGAPQYSDAANYARFAAEAAAEAGYPTATQFAANAWIANTGYINFLVLNLRLFGSLSFVGIEQLLLNCLLLWSVWTLCRRFGGRTVADLALTAFCLLPSNSAVVPAYMSDLCAMALLMASLVMTRRRMWLLFAAGALLAVANWVRPVAALYLPAVLVLALASRVPVRYYMPYVAGAVLATAAIAAFSYNSCGRVLTGSTTKGTNMIMGCCDAADGGYNAAVFEPGGAGYIDPAAGYDAAQRDSVLTRRSVEWILANPGRFAALMPVKVARLWWGDYYVDKVLAPGSVSSREVALLSVPYYLVLLLAFAGLFCACKRLGPLTTVALFLPVVAGTCMHLLMYGGMRYHAPMMPPLYFFAAVALAIAISRRTPK